MNGTESFARYLLDVRLERVFCRMAETARRLGHASLEQYARTATDKLRSVRSGECVSPAETMFLREVAQPCLNYAVNVARDRNWSALGHDSGFARSQVNDLLEKDREDAG